MALEKAYKFIIQFSRKLIKSHKFHSVMKSDSFPNSVIALEFQKLYTKSYKFQKDRI